MTRLGKALLIGAAVGLLGLVLRHTALGLRLEEAIALPFLFMARGPVEPPRDVVVVTLDSNSARQAGLNTTEWPPPRRVHASVIRALAASNVSAIVMDVLFDKERSAVDDNDLADAMARSGNVVLAQKLERLRMQGAGVEIDELRSPIDQLRKSAIGLAPFPLPEGPLVHSFWSFFPATGGEIPTLPAVALQVHALPILDRLVALLEQAGELDLHDLPRRVTTVTDSGRLMDVLRREFRDNAEAVQRALSLLNATENGDLSEANRRILTSLLRL